MRHLAGCLLVSCAPVAAPPTSHTNQMVDATVLLDGRCAAVARDAHSLLTADHCVLRSRTPFRTWRNEARTAELVRLWTGSSLAELRSSEPLTAAHGNRLPELGELVVVLHHRCPGGWCATPARVLALSDTWSEGLLDWAAPSGASGSGVWGQDGSLLGIVTHRGALTHWTYFAFVPR